MLTDLLTWFSGRDEQRRAYPRRSGGFRVWYAGEGGWKPLSALDISASGMGFISPSKFDKAEINFRIVVEDKPILVRASQVWCVPGTLQGRPVWRYGVRYTGISADDWDALVRFCSNEPVAVDNKAQKDLALIRMQADDVARLIPQRLQDRLLTMLVAVGRLGPIEKDKIPLVQFFYGGTIKRGTRQMHRLSIHSRIVEGPGGEPRTYDTRFQFDDTGTEIEMEKA